jgi:hypothetical protein
MLSRPAAWPTLCGRRAAATAAGIARANTRDSVRKGCGTCPRVIPETALCVIFVAEEGASAVPGEGKA